MTDFLVYRPEVQRLAIVDDDRDTAELTAWQVEEAGFEPVLYQGSSVANPTEVTQWIMGEAHGVICDHRLMGRGFANFYGARVVNDVFGERKVPAILVTQYIDMDQDVSIRRWRRNVPVLLSRDEANAETIRSGIELCLRELIGDVPTHRRSYRTLLRVEDLGDESSERIMDVIIPSWNNHHAVRLPINLAPVKIHSSIVHGTWLAADVNIGAERAQDLFFADLELAPEPTDEAFAGISDS